MHVLICESHYGFNLLIKICKTIRPVTNCAVARRCVDSPLETTCAIGGECNQWQFASQDRSADTKRLPGGGAFRKRSCQFEVGSADGDI